MQKILDTHCRTSQNSKQHYYLCLFKEIKQNLKKYWHLFDEIIFSTYSLFVFDSKSATDAKNISGSFNDYLVSVGQRLCK